MICRICRQAEIVGGYTSVNLERGEMKYVVHDVPARVCPGCGEAYVDEDVAVRLLQDAHERDLVGVRQVTVEYLDLIES